MKRLAILIVIFTSTMMLSSCACNSGCGGSSAFDTSFTGSGSCCGSVSSSCCGSGGW